MKAPVVDLHDAQALVEIVGTGTLEAVAINDLKFDKEYQRDLRAEAVQEMADSWDPKVAGAIVVNRRPTGGMYVIDGQHRTAAAKGAGESHIVAFVFENLTRAQEAAMRVKGNVRQVENPQERFRAKLAAGDEESKAIARICADYGTKINTNPTDESGINCVGTIEKLYRRDDGELVAKTFNIIKRAWGAVSKEHGRADVIKAIAHVVEVNGDELDTDRLIDRLQQEGSQGLRMKANSHQATWGGKPTINWYRALIEVYNTGLQQRNRLHPRIRGRSS